MPSAADHPFFHHPDLPDGAPLALAHRGFSLEGLENSMRAFAAAIDLGFRHLETDVHATADGVLIAFHDGTLDRVTDSTGAVHAQRWDAVSQARIRGVEPIPKLEEVLDTWPDIRVNVDVKVASAIDPLIDVIERTRSHDRLCLTSFSDSRRRAVARRLSRPVAQSPGKYGIAGFRIAAALKWSWLRHRALRDTHCLQVPPRSGPISIVTDDVVRTAHDVGRQIHVWTVNDTPSMERLLDLGVDGLVTDRSDLLRDVFLARGHWNEAS